MQITLNLNVLCYFPTISTKHRFLYLFSVYLSVYVCVCLCVCVCVCMPACVWCMHLNVGVLIPMHAYVGVRTRHQLSFLSEPEAGIIGMSIFLFGFQDSNSGFQLCSPSKTFLQHQNLFLNYKGLFDFENLIYEYCIGLVNFFCQLDPR